MPNIFKTHFIIAVLISTISSTSLFAQSLDHLGISQERLQRLDTVMQEYIEQDKLAGNVVYVARRGEVIYHKAFGWKDKATKQPMNNNSMFRIASQTKAITSVAVMILQEEGKLLINDPVGKYLPEYMETTVAVDDGSGGYNVVPANRKITIRDLLTHTAGIGYGYGPGQKAWEDAGIQGWYFADRNEPIRETVRRMAKLPHNSQPGEEFVYGYNTDILGALVEVVSGVSLDQYLHDHILNPLEMNDTHFYVPQDKEKRIAQVYSLRDSGLELAAAPGDFENASHVGQGHYVDGPRMNFSGGAGFVSTAEDYGTFLQMILNGGSLNGKRILSPKSVELMTENHIGDISVFGRDGLGFGLGFQITKDLGAFGEPGSVNEYGWGGAYHSVYWVDPKEELVVVYLSQLIPAGDIDDHSKLRALVYQSLY